jgi:hypothetical protein
MNEANEVLANINAAVYGGRRKAAAVDNPTAFPSWEWANSRDKYPIHGMSLRDYFAGKALAGMLADGNRASNFGGANGSDDDFAELSARWAYRLADAMLKERGDMF